MQVEDEVDVEEENARQLDFANLLEVFNFFDLIRYLFNFFKLMNI